MRYVCLIYQEGVPTIPPSPGLSPGGGCLADSETATTVRVRDGGLLVMDGPPATARPLAGLHVIEARDLNDAIRIASGLPAARSGAVEVRPVRPGPGPGPA